MLCLFFEYALSFPTDDKRKKKLNHEKRGNKRERKSEESLWYVRVSGVSL